MNICIPSVRLIRFKYIYDYVRISHLIAILYKVFILIDDKYTWKFIQQQLLINNIYIYDDELSLLKVGNKIGRKSILSFVKSTVKDQQEIFFKKEPETHWKEITMMKEKLIN